MVIYNMRLAGLLMSDGFILTAMEKDNRNPKYNVFVFKDTEELRERIKYYKELNKKR